MAFFRRSLAQRLLGLSRINNPASITTCRTSLPRTPVALNHHNTPRKLAPDPGDDGVFRRYLHRHSAASAIGLLPTGETLLEKLRGMNIRKERIRLDGLIPPPASATEEGEMTVADAKKILRLAQMERVKSRLRQIDEDCVSYTNFLEICAEECANLDLGLEFAKILDESGDVIVIGNNVFLKPHQVVKAIQGLIPAPVLPQDPRMQELQELEKQKAVIDKKATTYAKRELYGGLAYLVVQTLAFMRLTFWELTWDVMEPVCFYVTTSYFMAGYWFFLRTSKEPTFEGFFQSRFRAKQKRLIEKMKFDIKRYDELKKACSIGGNHGFMEAPLKLNS